MDSKFYFSQWKTFFSWFFAKVLKFVVISHSLCYVWNVSNLILCKLPILFSKVKLKLGHNFPNSLIDVIFAVLSIGLRLYFQVVPNSQRDFGILKLNCNWTFQFIPIHYKDGKLSFLKLRVSRTSKFFRIR